MNRLACNKCHRFLGMESIIEGELHLYCPNCKTWNIIRSRKVENVGQEKLDTEVKTIDTK